MTYKKTWLSYLLWAVYTCLTGVMLANYAILFWQKKINNVVDHGTVFFVFFVFVAVPGLYFLMRRIFGNAREKFDISSHTKSLWEIFIVLSLFSAGLLYRLSLYLRSIEFLTENSYYQLATVKVDENWEPIVHGASYLYTMCLSAVLSFLGNKVMVAVWLQILLQMAAILLAFFTVRRLVGRISACITMLVLAVSSVYAEQILTTTPESLFFVIYLVGMFTVGGYVERNCGSSRKRSSAVSGALLSGFIIGFLTYLDATALTLFIFLFGLVGGIRQEKAGKEYGNKVRKHRNVGFSVLLILTAAVAGVLTFIGMLALNAYSYYVEIEEMAEMLVLFYRTHFLTDYVLYQTVYSVVECFVVVILAALLIMAFWNRRKVQNASPWIVLMLLLAPTPLTMQGVLPYQVCSVFIWGVLAGIGVQQSLMWERPAAVKETLQDALEEPRSADPRSLEKPLQQPKNPHSLEKPLQQPKNPHSLEKPLQQPKNPHSLEKPLQQPEKPRFLENPLPLPKKHEKRAMDFQYEVTDEQMNFDLEVDENDDFDIE